MEKSILILSGGLDSSVASCLAKKDSSPILALTFDYGQKAALKEREAAGKIAKHLGVPHRILQLPWLAELTRTALVAADQEFPKIREEDLDDPVKGQISAKAVWIPNRNGLFLNIAASFAESLDAGILVTGFNIEEGLTFPDNSSPFVRAADEFFWYSTLKKVRVLSPTLKMNKVEIARKAKDLGIPLGDLWFCYNGAVKPCRRCESCLRGFRAFREVEIPDPWQ